MLGGFRVPVQGPVRDERPMLLEFRVTGGFKALHCE